MYEELKRRLQVIIDREPLETINGDIISAYDLIVAINEELKEVREVLNSRKSVLAINERYKMINVLSRKVSKLFTKSEESAIGMPRLLYISFDCGNNKSSVLFEFSKDATDEKYLRINKYFDEEAIFFNKTDVPYVNQKTFVKDNYEYIKNSFQILESFIKKYDLDISCGRLSKNKNIPQVYSDGFLSLEFNIFSFTAAANMNLCDKNLDDIYYAEWLDKERLNDFVTRNSKKFLSNIQISIQELNPLYRKFIESYQSKKEERTKVLEK